MSVDPTWKGLYKTGGASFLVAGILFIIGFFLLFFLGPLPSTTEAALKTVAEQKLLFQTNNGIFTLATILFIPALLALYLALKEVDKTGMLIASGLSALAITLFLGAIIVNYSLIILSREYGAATTDAQRAAYVAAADLVRGAAGAGFALSVLIFSVAVLIVSRVMLKGIFGKGIAYLGIITGIVGLVGGIPVPVLSIIGLVSVLFFAAWFLAVGNKLYKLG